jgi:hypothetical protein
MAEWTIVSAKAYSDPFNQVELDVVFERDGQHWRVPTFWRGENRWTVRFRPPQPGEYRYHYESNDKRNGDLNGHAGRVEVRGIESGLIARGMPRVSSNHRYFETADGKPFFWLGDTWWTGLSGRLSWEGFQQLAKDRSAKGFTVIQLCGGLAPSYEEQAPIDPGFCNEGGCVWDAHFERINPKYFDFADRRIAYLLENGLTPAIVGGWRGVLQQMGPAKMREHWRYLIARYGAYPVFWIAGGEIYDPPPAERRPQPNSSEPALNFTSTGWTDIVRYIRATDPYHHPLSVHEIPPPYDRAIMDESLTDFDLFQASHQGWPSLATEIALLDKHYARTTVTKPLVVGEVGYEGLGGAHGAEFQRAAFWLGMLNGAAGFTYGAVATWQSYSAEAPFHRQKFSFLTWQEGMQLPGSAQVGLNARLLERYPWWDLEPHPDWITPRGTTLLDPNREVSNFDIDLIGPLVNGQPLPDEQLPAGEWQKAGGNDRLPYAAGIPTRLRIVYLPYARGLNDYPAVTIQSLEPQVRYHAYYFEPALGIKIDLGFVAGGAQGAPGAIDSSHLERRLYDAGGTYRGFLGGPGWETYGTHGRIEGDRYTPEKPPGMGDWVLILEASPSG